MKVSRVYRLLKLISTLRSGRPFDADSLATELGVSRRTFFRDLQLLEKAGVPYQYEHGRSQYSISDDFFLAPVHLDLQEALALLLITRKFLSRNVHPAYQKATDAAIKIESTLPRLVREHCGAWLQGVSVHWPPVSGVDASSNYFQLLQFALVDKQKVRIRYDSVHDQREFEDLLEPLRLVFKSRGWYLIAKSREFASTRTYKIDRMTEVSLTEEHFEPEPDFDERKYFGAAWQMIPEGRLYNIKLCFDAIVASAVEEVHWHDSQATHRLDDGRLIFEATVDGLGEITSWILSYGGQVAILGPPELQEAVRNKVQKMAVVSSAAV